MALDRVAAAGNGVIRQRPRADAGHAGKGAGREGTKEVEKNPVRGKEPHEKNKKVKLTGIEKYLNRNIRLNVKESIGMVVVEVIDGKTGEVVKQIPPEELVRVHEALREHYPEAASSLLVEKEA